MNQFGLEEMENLFVALGDKTRLRLLNLMRRDEICVCFFTEVLRESQPKISRHLASLRNAGIVEARRDGKWVHYRIAKPKNERVQQILNDTLEWLETQDEMRGEYEILEKACCAPGAPVTIARAPKPEIFAEKNMSVDLPEKKELDTYLL